MAYPPPKVNEIQPDLKIEIRLMKEYENRQTVFSRLGIDFDLLEGIYAKEPTIATEKFMQAVKVLLVTGS